MSESSSENRTVQFRQGDVLITRIDRAKPGTQVARDGGRIVLAYGEATGHAHAIRSQGASLYQLPEDQTIEGDSVWARAARILRVTAEQGVRLRHEEHGEIHLPPGDYLVTRQREYSPAAVYLVAD